MSWKKFAADYLTLPKKDRIALLFFIGFSALLYSLTLIPPKAAPVAIQEDTALRNLLDAALLLAQKNGTSVPETDGAEYRYEVSKKSALPEGILFRFDPNTLDAAGWKKLGLPDRTIKTILNYRAKGGRFYRHEDLKKIWGLPQGFYERVQEHTDIAKADRKYESTFSKTPYEKQERRLSIVDVNKADTAALIALPGIGSRLAQRIITFRDKLGGFYSVAQIGETYGLPDSTFQMLKPYLQVQGTFKKFNLNTATKDDLKGHPYIKWQLANAIVEYRQQHGLFKKLEDLKNIMLVGETTYNKIAPYLTL